MTQKAMATTSIKRTLKLLALFYAILSVVHLQLIEWLAIVNMVQAVKKLHYSLLFYSVVKPDSTQMVFGNCEHVANSKEIVLFFCYFTLWFN